MTNLFYGEIVSHVRSQARNKRSIVIDFLLPQNTFTATNESLLKRIIDLYHQVENSRLENDCFSYLKQVGSLLKDIDKELQLLLEHDTDDYAFNGRYLRDAITDTLPIDLSPCYEKIPVLDDFNKILTGAFTYKDLCTISENLSITPEDIEKASSLWHTKGKTIDYLVRNQTAKALNYFNGIASHLDGFAIVTHYPMLEESLRHAYNNYVRELVVDDTDVTTLGAFFNCKLDTFDIMLQKDVSNKVFIGHTVKTVLSVKHLFSSLLGKPCDPYSVLHIPDLGQPKEDFDQEAYQAVRPMLLNLCRFLPIVEGRNYDAKGMAKVVCDLSDDLLKFLYPYLPYYNVLLANQIALDPQVVNFLDNQSQPKSLLASLTYIGDTPVQKMVKKDVTYSEVIDYILSSHTSGVFYISGYRETETTHNIQFTNHTHTNTLTFTVKRT